MLAMPKYASRHGSTRILGFGGILETFAYDDMALIEGIPKDQ